MITLDAYERKTFAAFKHIKQDSGLHSPSMHELFERLPMEMEVRIDACFLSNPYATDLFLDYLEQDLLKDKGRLRKFLEFYPSQNYDISKKLAQSLDISPKHIFMGNGATEVIQAVLHNFTRRKIAITLPTFSSYHEFVKDNVEIAYYPLKKQSDFLLDIPFYLQFIRNEKPNTVVIINPNNPNGGYLKYEQIETLIQELYRIETIEHILLDESFIHFSFEDESYEFKSATKLFRDFQKKLIIIKSMSKDFGIAGIRAGYAIMSEEKVKYLLSHGYLWNISGMAQYFFEIYAQEQFLSKYEIVRQRYVQEAQAFFQRLGKIPQLKTYPTCANFALLELLDGTTSSDFFARLLIQHGIYTRDCSDKKGLEGEFIRISAKTDIKNQQILDSIQQAFDKNGAI